MTCLLAVLQLEQKAPLLPFAAEEGRAEGRRETLHLMV